MAIRTTQSAVAADFLSQTQKLYSRMSRTQHQMETGLAITRPSDNPFGTGQVMNYDTELADLERFQENVASSMNFMAAADTALASVTDALREIRRLTKSADGSKSLVDMQAISQQILQLKETVRDGANAQFGNQYIFGGTATATQPYPTPGNAYTGSANTMQTRIASNQTVTINATGDTVFGAAPNNIFDLIDQVAADIAAGNVGTITTDVATLDAATEQVINVRTALGTTAARLEVTRDRLAATEERVLSSRAEIAEVDPTEAFMRFNQQQMAYQAALASGTRMMQTSILNFL